MSILDLVRTKTPTWTYAEIPANQTKEGLARDPIPANQFYITVKLKSFRIPDLRDFSSSFYGTVHSNFQILSQTGDMVTMQSVTTPQQLVNADPKHLERTILQEIEVLGPVPFIGGKFSVCIDLFSVMEADLAGPYLNLLGSIASKAGISVLSQGLQLAQPIIDGVNAIVDSKAGGLQIGIYKEFGDTDLQQGYYAIVAATEGTYVTSRLGIDNSYNLVDFTTKVKVDQAYLVFTVERSTSRTDWHQIPDVKDSYAQIVAAERARDVTKINDAFTAFKITVDTCPDLLSNDQDAVINAVEAEVTKLLAVINSGAQHKPLPALADLNLF